MIRFLFHHGPHHHTGHGCNCKKTSCRKCSPMTCSVGVYGKDVYYGNNNLIRFHVSCGENFDSIIEKAFIYAETLSKEIDKLKLILNSESILSRIEELEADLVSLQNSLDILKSNMGNNASLKTTHRLTLVGAINELYDSIVALGAGGGGTIDPQILQDIADLKAAVTLINTNIGSLTSLNTTVKTSLVNAVNEVNNKIGDLNTLTTTNKTNVVAAINEVNAKVPVLGTLNNLPGVTTQATNFTDAINDRQPVWKKSTTITVGASQAAPFNNLETAIEELKKYHFPEGRQTLNLESGTYNLTKNLVVEAENLPPVIIKSVTGNKTDVTIDLKGFTAGVQEQGTLIFQDLTITNTVDIPNYLRSEGGGNLNLVNVNINTFNHNHTVIIAGGILSKVFYSNLTINTTLDNTKTKRGFYVGNTASMLGTNLVINNYAVVITVTSNARAEMGGVQFTNVYNTAFQCLSNSSLMVSGNNNFDSSNNPTGFENTVNYTEAGTAAVFYAWSNSNIQTSGLRVKNLGTVSNTSRIDNLGNVNSWVGSNCLGSTMNSRILSNLNHFDNFTSGVRLDRNGIITLSANKFINLNYYVNGYVGQVAHAWATRTDGTAISNMVSKNTALTNSTSIGVLIKPFGYDNDFITFTGWSNSAPVII